MSVDSIGPLTGGALIALCSVMALYRVYILPGYERDRVENVSRET